MVRTGLKSLFKFQKEVRKQSHLKINSWSILFFMAFQKRKNRDGFFLLVEVKPYTAFLSFFSLVFTPHLYHKNVIPLLMTFL